MTIPKIYIDNQIYNEEEQINAISYMYGVSYSEAKENLTKAKYTEKEIKKSILYEELDGMPYDAKRKVYDDLLKRYNLR